MLLGCLHIPKSILRQWCMQSVYVCVCVCGGDGLVYEELENIEWDLQIGMSQQS